MLYSDSFFETDQWVEMIQVNECGLRESSGEKKEAIEVGAKFVWEDCGCDLIVRVMEGKSGTIKIYTQLYVTATEK